MLVYVKDIALRCYYYIFDHFILYPLMQVLPKQFEIKFMNLGYSPRPYGVKTPSSNKSDRIKDVMDELIEPSDSNRAHCYLYEKALSMCPIYPLFADYDIAEVGCGLGGGVEWIKRAHPETSSVIGIDKIIKATEDGTLIEGDAQSLPLASESKDLIINIESSHLYENPQKFFAEVYRVLKPNGYFCWADLRYKDDMATALEQASQAKLHLVTYENITAEVLNGIEFTSRHYDRILDKAPWFIRAFRHSIRATYCAPGTHTYNRFARREKIYAAACWCKKDMLPVMF